MEIDNLEIGEEIEAYNTKRELLKFKLRKTKSKYVGQILKNKSGEEFKVLGQTDIRDNKGGYSYLLIKFKSSMRLVVHSNCIKTRDIKNPNSPSVFGVGFIGQGEYIPKHCRKEYRIWSAMINRCYNEKYQEQTPTYKDCSVAPRWHNFQNFCEDIQFLEGYKEWKENTIPRKYALDKDIKIEGNKVYSKDTCMFVTNAENNAKVHLTGKLYRGIAPDGQEFLFNNIRQFAKEHDLHPSNISSCFSGRLKAYKGWTFEVVDT